MKRKLNFLIFSFIWMFFTAALTTVYITVGYAQLTHQSVTELLIGAPAVERFADSGNSVVTTPKEMTGQSEAADARVALVHNFLTRHNSPILEEDPEFAQFLVGLADTHGMDFRLLPAIAMQESNLCKVIPEGSHNCLGLGVHKRGTWGFETYRENFTAAAKILKENYINKGLTTTEQIEKKYNPTSANRDGSWASSVNQWMAEMRYDDRQLGKEKKSDADLLEFIDQ
ncbi:hypothetical protein KA078_02060 [Candidatus Woesebacteria bacterium]|nr:hypothetical protein [Candidatus Woesebacteria bacterium]